MHKIGDLVVVNDRMQKGYGYRISARMGRDFADGFALHFSPAEMLKLGVFEGRYCNDCRKEFPASWFRGARISEIADPTLNYCKVKSWLPLSEWRRRKWIVGPDPRGWFQWYCRYYLGRRIHDIDAIRIRRWRAFSRHAGQIRANCEAGDFACRPRQRQALLQWAHDPFI